MKRCHWLAVILLCLTARPVLFADSFIWVEGEDASRHSMQRHGWYDSVKHGELSGQKWLSHFAQGEMPVARYDVTVEQAGPYEFWLRANPVAAKMAVRVNGQDWTNISLDRREQNINIASDAKPDLRFVAWIKADPLTLHTGNNVIEVRFESENHRHGGLDCFVLSREPFFPQGALKPGEKTGLADPGTWAFEPERDKFSLDSLLDLSALNEKPAGKHGRIARSPDGSDFVDGAGKPIRFWAVNTSVQRRDDMAAVEEHARWLAKRGVNMVRHHGHLAPSGTRLDAVNQNDIDAAWRLVAAMKKHGIYVTLSPYWAVDVKYRPEWGLKDPGGDNLTGLLFFDETLQSAYKGWLRKLLTTPNPHTGIPLAEDPALAIFQIQNEDSLLFWTESAIQGQQRIELGKRFGGWLRQKHGSLKRAVASWGGEASVEDDHFADELVMPMPIYHLTQPARHARAARLSDQLQFYTELMHSFNQEIARFLKDEIGYQGLINAGNWRTADQSQLLDAERFSYTANDVIGVNRYYNGGMHTNPTDKRKAGYLISPDDEFSGQSALKRFWEFPLGLRQVKGFPMIISESAWVPPLRYQSEGPPLVAAYSCLTGFDIFYWFATDQIGYGPPMDKWQLSTPAQLGMFPAAALLFRKEYLQRGQPALVEHRSLEQLWQRSPPRLPEEAGYDPNRDTNATTTTRPNENTNQRSPLLYLAGSVEVDFQAQADTAREHLNETQITDSTVVSNTKQLRWNYDKGYCTIDAPKAQGVLGHLQAAGTVTLSTIAVRSANPYANVVIVALDDVKLTESRQVLLQIGTVARPYGWKTQPAGEGRQRIVNMGSSPWNIANANMQIAIKNSQLNEAIRLDANGMPVEKVPLSRTRFGVAVEPPSNSMYLLLTAKP